MLKKLQELYNDESGSYFVEIGLALTFITLAIVLSVSGLSDGIKKKFTEITTELDSVRVPEIK